jgi:chaperonin GroEL (HSP60 family)
VRLRISQIPRRVVACAVTELRKRHAEGSTSAGINVKRGLISDILEENVLQPLLVSTSAINLSTETVRMILKVCEHTRVQCVACIENE